MKHAVLILAAGKGSRMKSDLPKVLHQVGNLPLVLHTLNVAQRLSPDMIVLVVGEQGDAIADAVHNVDASVKIAVQKNQAGTADAVKAAYPYIADFNGRITILFGDTPFVGEETAAQLLNHASECDLSIVGFETPTPGAYGRLVMDEGQLQRIVEAKDCKPQELKITLCNSGLMSVDADFLRLFLEQVKKDNAADEFYLTGIAALAKSWGKRVKVLCCAEQETIGVNSRQDLARAEAIFQEGVRAKVMAEGVTLIAPETVFLAFDTEIGADCVIEPNVVFGPGVTIGARTIIRSFSHLEGCKIGSDAFVGPYARIRPGTEIAQNARIGNFVEVKNAMLGKAAKVNHLSYIGDADIGPNVNIGAGTVICNYDGVSKHYTQIEAGAFIGSNSALVAPVKIGQGAIIGSGSTITKSVNADALALSRSPQEEKKGFAARYFSKLRAQKKKKQERG